MAFVSNQGRGFGCSCMFASLLGVVPSAVHELDPRPREVKAVNSSRSRSCAGSRTC